MFYYILGNISCIEQHLHDQSYYHSISRGCNDYYNQFDTSGRDVLIYLLFHNCLLLILSFESRDLFQTISKNKWNKSFWDRWLVIHHVNKTLVKIGENANYYFDLLRHKIIRGIMYSSVNKRTVPPIKLLSSRKCFFDKSQIV